MSKTAEICRLVLDTNVCLDLLLFADPAVAVLGSQLREDVVRAYRDEHTSEEWRRVLGYSVWGLSSERQSELRSRFEQMLTPLLSAAEPVAQLPQCRDRDDQKFLQLAAAVPATALISKDRDLLKLSRLCRRKLGLAILSPEQWCVMDPPAIDDLVRETAGRRAALLAPGF